MSSTKAIEGDTGKELNALRKDNCFCDVTLIVDERKYPCHRAVLAGACEYFSTMFRNFKEKSMNEIELHGFRNASFEKILHFVYTKEALVDENNVKDQLIAADMLGLVSLEKSCLKFLEMGFVPKDLIELFVYADLKGDMSLMRKIKSLINIKFTELCESMSLNQLTFKQLETILKDENLLLKREDTAFQGVIEWVKFEEESRKEYLSQLLPLVNVPSLATPYMIDLQLNEPFMRNGNKYRDMIIRRSALCSSTSSYNKNMEKNPPTQFMLFNKMLNGRVVQEFYTENDPTLRDINGLTFECIAFAATIVNNMLYVLLIEDHLIMKFQRINLGNREYRDLTPPPSLCSLYLSSPPLSTYEFALETDGDKIFLCLPGSRAIGFATNPTRIFVYTIEQDYWYWTTNVEVSCTSLKGFCFKCHDRRLYCIGGSLPAPSNIVQFLDLRCRGWNRLPPMNIGRVDPGACFYDNKLYVSGGYSVNSSIFNNIEVFDFNANRWMIKTPFLRRRCHKMYAIHNELYVVGGTISNISRASIADVNETSLFDQSSPTRSIWRNVCNVDRERIEESLLVKQLINA